MLLVRITLKKKLPGISIYNLKIKSSFSQGDIASLIVGRPCESDISV